MKKVYFIIFFVFILNSLFSQSFTQKKGGNCYTVLIPDYMSKTFTLNDNSSMQYMNTSKEAYMIVIEDDKDQLESLAMKYLSPREFLVDFLKEFKKDSKKRKVGTYKDFEANNNKLSQVELTWEEDGSGFYMIVTVVETSTHFYNIMCWTISENKDVLKEDFLKIAESLKE